MPDWKHEIRQRLADLKLSPMREAEIVEELAQHTEDRYEDLLTNGLTSAEAARAALVELSENDLFIQELRRVERRVTPEPITQGTNRRSNVIAGVWQDLRYCARSLVKRPGFTAVVVITLALGIGANTAIFSVLHGVLLKPLPYADPGAIVRVWQATPASGFVQLGMSEAQLVRLRAGNQSFQQIGGYAFRSVDLTDQNETQRIAAAMVSAGVF